MILRHSDLCGEFEHPRADAVLAKASGYITSYVREG